MASNWSSCARACARGGRRVHSSGYPRPSNSITSQCHERCCHHGLFYLFSQSPIEKPQNCRLTDVWRAKVQLSPVRFNLYQSRTWHEIGNIGVGFVGGCKGMLEGKSRKCPGREISIVARSGKNIRAKNKLTFFTLFKGFVLWTCFRSDCEGHCKGGKKKGTYQIRGRATLSTWPNFFQWSLLDIRAPLQQQASVDGGTVRGMSGGVQLRGRQRGLPRSFHLHHAIIRSGRP